MPAVYDQFRSYENKRQRANGDQRIKQTLVNADEMRQITHLALKPFDDNARRGNLLERKALKEASQERIKKWGNTIIGSFKKRLAAAELRAKLAEEERVKQDAEWEIVKNAEREEAIKRARQLQKFEEPRYRSLHSQLLLSNVLEERDAQIQFKMGRKLAEKIHEKEEILKLRLEHLKNLEKDRQKELLVIEKKKEFERGLAEDVKKKRELVDKEVMLEELRKIQDEIKQEEIQKQKLKCEMANNFKIELAAQIAEKNMNKQMIQERAVEFDEKNARFNSMKAMFAEKRKEFSDNTVNNRIKLTDHIAPLNVKAAHAREETRSEFLAAIAKGNFRKESVQTNPMITKEIFEREVEDYKQKRKESQKQSKENQKQLKLKEREDNLQLTEKWKKEEELLTEKKKKTLKEIKEFNSNYQKEYKLQKSQEHQQVLQLEDSLREAQVKGNVDFEEYASSVTKEWKEAGRNVIPVLKVMETERPGFVKRRPSIMKDKLDKVDHFERLGFTARWMPSEPKIPPIEGAIV